MDGVTPPIAVGKLTVGAGSSFEGGRAGSGAGVGFGAGAGGVTIATGGGIGGLGSGDVIVFGDVAKSQVVIHIMIITAQKTIPPIVCKQPFITISPLYE